MGVILQYNKEKISNIKKRFDKILYIYSNFGGSCIMLHVSVLLFPYTCDTHHSVSCIFHHKKVDQSEFAHEQFPGLLLYI